MNASTDRIEPAASSEAALQMETEQILSSGEDVRARLADSVARAAEQSGQTAGGLLGLVRAVLAGAREGFERSVPKDPDAALRQVVDALGDGLSRAALAGQLAVEEASGAYRQFSQTDLTRLREDLLAVESLFADTVGRALSGCRVLTTAQINSATTHAGRVVERLTPAFGRVVDAIRRHPLDLARGSVQAGFEAGRCATGALFQALGQMLQQAGASMAGSSAADKHPGSK